MPEFKTRVSRQRFLRGVSATAAVAACFSPLFAGSAIAQQAGARSVSEGGIQDIVVTARKRAEASQTVPLAITAVSAQDLELRRVTQVADVKALAPSISMQSDSYTNFGVKIGIRGQQSTDSLLQAQTSVGIYMDGVYVANSAGLLLSNLMDVQQVEVLKGPQGTLFGRNTTGGAMVVTTNLPSYDKISNRFSVGAGNFDRFEISNTLNIPLADNVAIRLSGQYSGNHGYARNIGRGSSRPMADQKAYAFRAALMTDPTDRLNVVLRADYSHGESHGRHQKVAYVNPNGAATLATLVYLGLWNAPTAAAPGGTPNLPALTARGLTPTTAFPFAADYILGTQPDDLFTMNTNIYGQANIKEYGFSGTLTYDLNDDVSLKSITAYRHMNYNSVQDSDASPLPLLDTPDQFQRLNVFSQELTLSGVAFGNRLSWAVGGYYFRQTGQDLQGPVVALAPINPRRAITDGRFLQKSAAAYGQVTFSLTDALRVTAGVRYTDESQRLTNFSRTAIALPPPNNTVTCDLSGLPYPGCSASFLQKADNISYTFSTDYTVAPDVMLYARTSRGFKGGGTNVRGALSFAPESVTDYEIGLKSYLFDRKIRFNAAVYQSDYKNIQRVVIIPDGRGGVTSLVNNAASARIKGAEVDILVRPIDGLTLAFAGAYTDPQYRKYISNGVDRSGNVFQAVTKWSWNAAASYEIPVGDAILRPSTDMVYQSTANFQADSNTPALNSALYTTQKGYALVNARLAYEWDGGDTSVSLWVKNIADKKYMINALDVAQSIGFVVQNYGPPRSYGIQFTKTF
ncbi:iron complex outermembrane recepter protein [Sphingobium faniae]|nr:iron complex outermembrane recepter protein [Sphingobium faniae]